MKLSALQIGLCTSLLIHGTLAAVLYANQRWHSAALPDAPGNKGIELILESEEIVDSAPAEPLIAKKNPEVDGAAASDWSKASAMIAEAVLPPPASRSSELMSLALTRQALTVSEAPDSVLDTGVDVPSSGSSQGSENTRSPVAYSLNPKPCYPREARRRRQEGLVLLRVLVTPEGEAGVVEMERSSGFKLLDDTAVESVWHWRFVPASNGITAVASHVQIPVRFTLSK